MNRLILLVYLILAKTALFAQSNVVKWDYAATKVSDNVYNLEIKAGVQSPWHIYSLSSPDGGPLPTKINFNKNPLVTLQGETTEKGKLIQKHEEVFDVDVKYFDGNVIFTQTIKLKTKVEGSIEFMACNEAQCLPPMTINFSIPVQ